MAGGGNFTTQNKSIPGAYINVISASKISSSNIGERGVVGICMDIDWGPNIIELDRDSFNDRNSVYLLSEHYYPNSPTSNSLNIRKISEIFKNAKKIYIARTNGGNGKAWAKSSLGSTNSSAVTANYGGTCGNSIKIKIENAPNGGYNISTYMLTNVPVETVKVDSLNIATWDNMDNLAIHFDVRGGGTAVVGTYTLSTGADGDMNIQEALNNLETVKFNTLVADVATNDAQISTKLALYEAYTNRMNNELGVKFNCVFPKNSGTRSNEHIICCNNYVSTLGMDLCYWVAGADAACPLNQSLTNKLYDGELSITWNSTYGFTQAQLETAIAAGKFTFYKYANEFRVTSDVNTYTGDTTEKSKDFAQNQTVRFINQSTTDTAAIFTQKYMGVVQNNRDGRTSFWSDLVSLNREYEALGIIEDFVPTAVTVSEGVDKRTMVVNQTLKLINALEKLYMTTEIE